MISRRAFAGLVASAGVSFLLPAARSQSKGGIARVGYLASGAPGAMFDAFRTGLRELGYLEGRNIAIEFRAADGNYETLPALAAELVALNLEVSSRLSAPPPRSRSSPPLSAIRSAPAW
jgi:putative tryptophan/tyrosine transport system substrate-binding protein